MKKIIFLSLIFLSAALASKAGVIIIEGKYQNNNLFVQNGLSESGIGYCTYEVRINGRVCTDEINSSAFEIDFKQFELKPGSEVTVEIKHKDGCRPKILNPEALRAKATFDVMAISISKGGLLEWTSKNESGPLPYIIEQFKWNKWVPVGEVTGKGSAEEHKYSYQITAHSGENKFRVKQIGFGSQAKYSQPVMYLSTLPKVTFTSSEDSDKILFSGESMYEVYDDYGNILKKGYAKQVDVSNLYRGTYFLCFDNNVKEFQKK
jgi:hypothetical protein